MLELFLNLFNLIFYSVRLKQDLYKINSFVQKMPLADLPYKIEKLFNTGQYAYLGRTMGRKTKISKLRLLRNVTLCDGPSLWHMLSEKPAGREYAFFVRLRLFATREMVDEYLASPELQNYCSSKSQEIPPSLKDDDIIITKDNYTSEEVQTLIFEEYKKMLLHKDSVDDLMNHLTSEDQQQAACLSDDKKKKKRAQLTLKQQLMLIQSTPSRVIDVSNFGETMKHQKGKILERLQHSARISKCVELGQDFPIISDNIPSFERAMNSLGPRYYSKTDEFKNKYSSTRRC